MIRKAFISLVAIAAIGTGLASMTSAADAHYRRHHHSGVTLGFFPFFGFPGYGYGYPGYYDDYYDDQYCRIRRVPVKKWNASHTHHYIVYRKKWVCY